MQCRSIGAQADGRHLCPEVKIGYMVLIKPNRAIQYDFTWKAVNNYISEMNASRRKGNISVESIQRQSIELDIEKLNMPAELGIGDAAGQLSIQERGSAGVL